MLRIFSAKNLIHFNNGIRLEFETGANFLIGRNATGKTAALELIRRCHSSKINITTISSIPNSKEAAYAFSLYENVGKWRDECIRGALISIYVDPSEIENRKIYKIIALQTENEDIKVYSKKINFIDHESFQDLNPSKIDRGVLNFGDNFSEEDFMELIRTVKNSKSRDTWKPSLGSEGIDAFLNFFLSQFGATLPHRGISPVMWTGSLIDDQRSKQELCKFASERADIIRSLLKDTENVDQDEAERIFSQLCSESFEFELKDDKLTVKICGKEVPLFRIPAGAFEAKQLSLLLAHNKIKTLCLEEPYRGMHQGMIKKLGNLVLQRVKDKTLVIVSHEQALISPWSLQRTYIFKKSLFLSSPDAVIHEAVKFPADCIKYGESEEMKAVLFSSSVVFVEGETDRIILQALFMQIVNEEKRSQLKALFEYLKDTTSLKDKTIESIFARIEIVKLDGEKGGLCRKLFCQEKIGIPSILVLDRKAIFEKFPGKIRPNYINEKDRSKPQFQIRNEEEWKDKYPEIKEYLGKSGVFVWKSGNIEDVIVDKIDRTSDIFREMRLSQITSGDKKELKDWKSDLKSKNPALVEDLAIAAAVANGKISEFALLVAFIAKTFGHKTMNTSTIQKLPRPPNTT